MTRETSLLAYDLVKPKINHIHEEIIAILLVNGQPMSRDEINKETNRLYQTVSPRFAELINLGIIEPCGVKMGINGRNVELVNINPKWLGQ